MAKQIRVRGTPNKATLGVGDKAITIVNNRSNKLWCPKGNAPELYPQIGRWIQKVDYDNFFIGLNPKFVNHEKDAWFAFCACGSPAVIVGYNVYKEGASVSTHGETRGEMIVCESHARTGRHADGST